MLLFCMFCRFKINAAKMASSSPTSWAQEVIICDFCDKAVQQFCNNCQVNLCGDCINRHVNKHKSLTHDIVPFKNRKLHLVFPECEFHPNQRCEVHCQKCDVPVCIKCFLGQHKGHDAVEISDIVHRKKQQIKREMEEIESVIIPKFKNNDVEIERKNLKSGEDYDQLEKETEKLRKCWHQEVDTIFNNLRTLIKSMRDNDMEAKRAYKTKCKNLISEMIQTVRQNKDILKTNRVPDVINYKSKLKEYRDIPDDIDVKIPSLNAKTVQGGEFSVELEEYRATLTQESQSGPTNETMTKMLDKAKVIATISTHVKPTYCVACVGTGEVWVSGDNDIIKHFDIHGSLLDTVIFTGGGYPNDISVTRQGELIYSDSHSNTVKIVRNGKTETLVSLPNGWCPCGICCTRSGDILVTMSKTDYRRNKIVRYQDRAVKCEINEDEDGTPILSPGSYLNYVTENVNGDICVSDSNAGKVVVVDKTGKVRFRYDGSPAKRKEPLDPLHIVTDSKGHIIVADENNDCLHILDQNGQFLRSVDNCGLNKPSGLSLDKMGRLWVGLKGSKDLKVIQYMI
ncbi:E3 ubiquitin-protein ligase TRIM71-like [Saccostrea echinata]|uniref:E3 ubiquitin-protein ligase TRIM71-like n=1 Tax=Saccostrea echinata TaxID=191078 RepID=UPI002A83AD68|nr:E3 ubiquitin-protein ligase TRIM71-like [Saccostrea echinata]